MAQPKTNDAYDDLFDYYGQIYNVDPALGKTVFHIESTGNPNAPNGSSGEVGGMQIMPKLAQHYGIDPRDMTQAIPAAMANLAEGLRASGGDPVGALRYYNGGPRALADPQSTNGYIAKARSWFPHIQLIGSANAAPLDGTRSATPPATSPDLDKFRSEWGLGGAAPKSASDVDAFRKEWGLTPAGSNAPTGTKSTETKPTAASDSAASAPRPPQMGNPATALNAAGGDQFIPNPLASNPSQSNYTALRSAVARDPNYTYAQNAPVAMDAAGNAHFALPGVVHDLAGGAVDLLYGPQMGTVTPEATNALATGVMMTPRLMRSPANIPGRFTLFPRRTVPEITPAGPGPGSTNPLASAAAIEPPTPAFTPSSRSFEVDAHGNVTQSGLPAVTTPEAPGNPLASRAVTAPGTGLTAPSTGGATAPLTPAERLIQASIAAGPAGMPGAAAPPPGAPPGAPPLGVPGYAPTTPGINPSTAPGLSPAEIAAYASMHDAPPPAPLIPPQTKAQAEALADRIVRYFHTGNPPIAPTDLVVPPGYHPTLTGLTNDPGLATLHRGLESVSGTPAVIAQHNAQAINDAAARLQGQPGDANAMEERVNKVTSPLREAAFANKTDMDAGKVQDAINAAAKQIAGPIGVDPGAAKVLTQVRDAMFESDGTPRKDAEMMYGVHRLINKLLSPLAQSTDADARAAASALMQIKPLVQTAIESGAGGFKAYMAKHAELMRSVDAQRLLENLNLTNANGDTRLAAIDSAIKAIERQQQMPGARKADSVTKDQMDQLLALRNALRMEAARGTGKPINSTTFQNLATNSMVSHIAGNPLVSGIGAQIASPGITGLILGQAASAAGKQMLERSENLVRDALLERLLNFTGKGEATLAQKTAPRSPTPGAPWNPLSAGPPPP